MQGHFVRMRQKLCRDEMVVGAIGTIVTGMWIRVWWIHSIFYVLI